MRLPNMFGLLTASALLIGATSANALQLTLEEVGGGGATTTILDNGAGDLNPNDGAILFNGSIGSFTINIVGGLGDPALEGDNPHAAATSLTFNSVSSGPGTLRITLLDEGPDDNGLSVIPVGDGRQDVSSTININQAVGTVDVATFINVNDTGDQEINSDSLTNGNGTTDTKSLDPVLFLTMNDTFTLKTVALLQHDKAGNSLGTASIDVQAVPLPTALPLFLTALVGLGLVGRHRRKAA